MNSRRIIVAIALTILLCTSCDNTIKILAPYKDITIVYGLIDQNDPVHYFRINKGFEGNGNAYTMAQQYDSIYYPVGNITAVLEDSSTTTNSIVNVYLLDTTTSIPLGAGIFSYPKQLLYYTNATLNPNDYYNIVITNTKTGKKITGSTYLLPDMTFSNNDFVGSPTLPLSFNNTYPSMIQWNTSSNARIYQMTVRFYYDEVNSSNNVTLKSFDWVFPAVTSPTLSGNYPLSYSYYASGLLSLIVYYVPYEQGITRYVDSLHVIFTSGTDDLNTYVLLSQPPSGINQDVPNFSDVKNAVGLFTARHIQTFYKQLAPAFIDTLVGESKYSNLNFQQR